MDDSNIPIVFIHGWKASVLIDKNTGEEKFNYALPHLLGLSGPSLDLPMEWEEDKNSGEKRQAHDDMVASHPCRNVSCLCGTVKLQQLYGPLLNHLENKWGTNNVHTFAYDWRRELGETVLEFEAYLESIKSQSGGRSPLVIAHSMGCLITLHILNRRPDLFHSVLFGAGAMSPSFSNMEDYSLVGGINTIVKNDSMFTPSQHLTNSGSLHMLIAYPGEREKYGKENTTMLCDAMGNPVEFDLNKIDTWKQLQIGMYNPKSGVTVTPKKEIWLQSVLTKCKTFRKGLIPTKPSAEYPPVAVLRSDGLPTKFGFQLDGNGHVDFENKKVLSGDGRLMVEDAIPPKGVPVVKVITNKEEHSVVLNDLESVDELVDCLMKEERKKKKM